MKVTDCDGCRYADDWTPAGTAKCIDCTDEDRKWEAKPEREQPNEKKPEGSTAVYYELPPNAKELQDLIAFKNMNAQLGEIFRAAYRYGQCPHSGRIRELNKIIFYAEAELDRIARYEPIAVEEQKGD